MKKVFAFALSFTIVSASLGVALISAATGTINMKLIASESYITSDVHSTSVYVKYIAKNSSTSEVYPKFKINLKQDSAIFGEITSTSKNFNCKSRQNTKNETLLICVRTKPVALNTQKVFKLDITHEIPLTQNSLKVSLRATGLTELNATNNSAVLTLNKNYDLTVPANWTTSTFHNGIVTIPTPPQSGEHIEDLGNGLKKVWELDGPTPTRKGPFTNTARMIYRIEGGQFGSSQPTGEVSLLATNRRTQLDEFNVDQFYVEIKQSYCLSCGYKDRGNINLFGTEVKVFDIISDFGNVTAYLFTKDKIGYMVVKNYTEKEQANYSEFVNKTVDIIFANLNFDNAESEVPLYPEYFGTTPATEEYAKWLNDNPGYICAATLVGVVSNRKQNFDLWNCERLDSNRVLAIQFNQQTGKEVPVILYYTNTINDDNGQYPYTNPYKNENGLIFGVSKIVEDLIGIGLP